MARTHIEWAVSVLKEANGPLHYREITDRMNRIRGTNKTYDTMRGAICGDINNNPASEIVRVGVGKFDLIDRVITKELIRDSKKLAERIYKLAELSVADITEKLVKKETKVRIGDKILRHALLNYWNHTCPLDGVTHNDFLIASHIIPWKKNRMKRLDIHNVLLLSPFWDKAFDRGLVTFEFSGVPRFSNKLTEIEKSDCLRWNHAIIFAEEHLENIEWHQKHVFQAWR